jgi:hypothetical protein
LSSYSQYSAQLNVLGLRVYKNRANPCPTLPGSEVSENLILKQKETLPPASAAHVYSSADPNATFGSGITDDDIPSGSGSTSTFWAHPTPQVSCETHEAVLFDLEAIRTDRGIDFKPLTADAIEENAQMSNLPRETLATGGLLDAGRAVLDPMALCDNTNRSIRTLMDISRAHLDRGTPKNAEQDAKQRQTEEQVQGEQQGALASPERFIPFDFQAYQQRAARVTLPGPEEFLGKQSEEAQAIEEVGTLGDCEDSQLWATTSRNADISSGPSQTTPLEESPITTYGDGAGGMAKVPSNATDVVVPQDNTTPETLSGFSSFNRLSIDSEDVSSPCASCIFTPNVKYEPSNNALQLWDIVVLGHGGEYNALEVISVLAGFLSAARLYMDAFDLYYILWTKSKLIRSDQGLAAALNCARTSATPQQDLCLDMILHYSLQSSTQSSTKRVLHCFIAELYARMKRVSDADFHATMAKFHSMDVDDHMTWQDANDFINFRQRHKIIVAQKVQILQEKFGWHDPSLQHLSSESFLPKIQKLALVKHLLVWCTRVLSDRARAIDSFVHRLPRRQLSRESIRMLLLCHLLEQWLRDRQLGGSRIADDTKQVMADLELSSDSISPPEALSAMTTLIVSSTYLQGIVSPPLWRRRTELDPSLAILGSLKQLVSETLDGQDFAHVYLALVAASAVSRQRSLEGKSPTILYSFMNRIGPTNLINGIFSSGTDVLTDSLVLGPEMFQEYEIRPASLSNHIYTSRSSFSSGTNSFRATAIEVMRNSVLSLATLQNRASPAAMSIISCSSWSFSAVTSMPRAPSILSDAELVDHTATTIQEEPQDAEMVDVDIGGSTSSIGLAI